MESPVLPRAKVATFYSLALGTFESMTIHCLVIIQAERSLQCVTFSPHSGTSGEAEPRPSAELQGQLLASSRRAGFHTKVDNAYIKCSYFPLCVPVEVHMCESMHTRV